MYQLHQQPWHRLRLQHQDHLVNQDLVNHQDYLEVVKQVVCYHFQQLYNLACYLSYLRLILLRQQYKVLVKVTDRDWETHHKVILVFHQALVHQAILVEEAEAVLQLLVKQLGQTIITAAMVELVLHLTSQEVLLLEQVAEAEAL